MRVFVSTVFFAAAFAFAAAANTCPTCGGDLNDQGRCPYCQPKPKADR